MIFARGSLVGMREQRDRAEALAAHYREALQTISTAHPGHLPGHCQRIARRALEKPATSKRRPVLESDIFPPPNLKPGDAISVLPIEDSLERAARLQVDDEAGA